MINYLIESTISLTSLFVFYYLFLEYEKMHQFNRFYLLFSVVFSLCIPFFSIEIIEIVEKVVSVQNQEIPIFPVEQTAITVQPKPNYFLLILWSLYGFISVVLLVRFLKNLYQLKRQLL